jgi:multiple sugar transport system ATP-binding protein
MTSVLVKDVSLSFGAVDVLKKLNLEVKQGEFIVLLGPSGCGKSTLLNCIAGLLDVSTGQIFINGKNVTWEEPKDRGIGMVFQSYALYPQMTVEGNLSFGLKNARLPKDEIARRIARAAEILQIQPLLQRKPAALSGGQRQRVAIGRALVRDVDVFLFDEPLSNLDAKLRAELRVEIKRLHQQLANTMIYVTHDQIEAMTLADRIAVMRSGVIEQLDSPHEIYNRPVNRYVAGFIGSPGMNFLEGVIGGESEPVFVADGVSIPLSRYAFAAAAQRGAKVTFGIRPEHVAANSGMDWPFSMQARVEIVEPMGSDTLVWTRIGSQDIAVRLPSERSPRVGDQITIGFDPMRASIFDAESEKRL